MKIESFTINNYRSITQAYKVHLDSEMTVLLGKNNEGKSNILKALSGVFYIISLLKDNVEVKNLSEMIYKFRPSRLRKITLGQEWDYVWERDFPISKQKKNSTGKTSFDLNFILTQEEQEEFYEEVGHHFNQKLPFRIIIDKNRKIDIKIPKRAYGGRTKNFNTKINLIAQFISKHLSLVFIPAIRPADTSLRVVGNLLSNRVSAHRKDAEYEQALQTIKKIHDAELKKLQNELEKIIKVFIPNIQSIEIEAGLWGIVDRDEIREIKINDGIKTSIYEKGEGLQSLIALGVMQTSKKFNDESILVVDEPESHLHPAGIRQVKDSLTQIAKNSQVIIATHSPILVNRDNLSANVIVNNRKAKPVKSIKEIREILGIAVSDNLVNAEFVVLVEGETDKKLLTHFLSKKSALVANALRSGRLVFAVLRGCKNYITIRSLYNTFICKKIISFLDYDKTAKDITEQAIREHLIEPNEVIYAKIKGNKESELEDLLDITFYQDLLPIAKVPNFKEILNSSKKWSENIESIFSTASGVVPKIEEFKWKVSEKVCNQDNPFIASKMRSVTALLHSLESILK